MNTYTIQLRGRFTPIYPSTLADDSSLARTYILEICRVIKLVSSLSIVFLFLLPIATYSNLNLSLQTLKMPLITSTKSVYIHYQINVSKISSNCSNCSGKCKPVCNYKNCNKYPLVKHQPVSNGIAEVLENQSNCFLAQEQREVVT